MICCVWYVLSFVINSRTSFIAVVASYLSWTLLNFLSTFSSGQQDMESGFEANPISVNCLREYLLLLVRPNLLFPTRLASFLRLLLGSFPARMLMWFSDLLFLVFMHSLLLADLAPNSRGLANFEGHHWLS